MDFTREPIIETVITPKEGCKLVVRSSKSTAQEEYFVDAIEVVSFGHSFFFRSLERPKAFLVPVSDYEVLEVREARMVLKNVGIDRAIKIGGGRDAQMRGGHREQSHEKVEAPQVQEEVVNGDEVAVSNANETKPADPRLDKKRDRRRQYRRRRGREEGAPEAGVVDEPANPENKDSAQRIELAEPRKFVPGEESLALPVTTNSILTSLLPPPSTLISETIARYKDNALFRGAFYSKEEPKQAVEEEKTSLVPIEQPEYGSFEVSEEEEERIYQQRKQHSDQMESIQVEESAVESKPVSDDAPIDLMDSPPDSTLDLQVDSPSTEENANEVHLPQEESSQVYLENDEIKVEDKIENNNHQP